jgi:lipopolysaccharide export LptBFGC system permease protein LptF
LIPLSLIISSLFVIESLKQTGEFQALQTSGISRRKIFFPFYLLAICLSIFCYWNNEIGVQKASNLKLKSSKLRKLKSLPPFEIRYLKDDSKIIYQQNETGIFDLYWLKNVNEILHAKSVDYKNNTLMGNWVDVIEKNSFGRYEKSKSHEKLELPFEITNIKKVYFESHKMPISKTFQCITDPNLSQSLDRAVLKTSLFHKLTSPLFSLMIITFLLALFFRKNFLNPYLSFLTAIFAYLLFYSIEKTFIILGENYIVSPFIAVVLLPLMAQTGFTYILIKNKS